MLHTSDSDRLIPSDRLRFVFAFVALVFVVLSAGCSERVVVVRVTAADARPIAAARALEVGVTLDGDDRPDFTVTLKQSGAIPPERSFGVAVPEGRAGRLVIDVVARDADGQARGAGRGETTIAATGNGEVRVVLGPCPDAANERCPGVTPTDGGTDTADMSAGDMPDMPDMANGPDLLMPTCTNRLRDGDETDVDCGGKSCLPCALGSVCKLASDCRSASCKAGTSRCTGWEPVGPWGGEVSAIAVHPTNPDIAWVSTVGNGVFRSDDGGRRWVQAAQNIDLYEDLKVVALRVEPGAPDRIWAVAEGWTYRSRAALASVYRSTDGGRRFVDAIDGLPESLGCTALAMAPSDPKVLYLGVLLPNDAGMAVFRWDDKTSKWSQASAVLGLDRIDALAVDPKAPAVVWLGAETSGLRRSKDGGATWETIAGVAAPVGDVVIDPVTPSTVYAIANQTVVRSTDGGASWGDFTNGLSGLSCQSLAIDPKEPGRLFVTCEQRLFRVSPGLTRWAPMDKGRPATAFLTRVVVTPSGTGRVWAGADQGLWRSDDYGDGWKDAAAEALIGPVVYALAIPPKAPGTIYAGTKSGIYKSIDSGATWTFAGAGAETGGYVTVVADPNNADVVYAGGYGASVFKSEDGAKSWTRRSTGLPMDTRAYALVVDPRDSKRLFAGTHNGNDSTAGVYRSTDGGMSWQAASSGLPPQGGPYKDIRAMAIDGSTNPSRVYLSTIDGVYLSVDGGGAWSSIGSKASGLAEPDVWAITVDPVSPSVVWVGTANGVYVTTNAGPQATWKPAAGMDRYATGLVVDPKAHETVYAATLGDGVYKTTNSGASWSQSVLGTIYYPLNAVAVDFTNTATVYAAGRSGGVYRTLTAGD